MSICNAERHIIGLQILIINADGLQIRPNEAALPVRLDLDKSKRNVSIR